MYEAWFWSDLDNLRKYAAAIVIWILKCLEDRTTAWRWTKETLTEAQRRYQGKDSQSLPTVEYLQKKAIEDLFGVKNNFPVDSRGDKKTKPDVEPKAEDVTENDMSAFIDF